VTRKYSCTTKPQLLHIIIIMHIGFQQLPSVSKIILFQQLQKIIINKTKEKKTQKTQRARIFYRKMNLHSHIQEIKVKIKKIGVHTQGHLQ